MNPTRTQATDINKPNLFKGIENWSEFEKAEPENTSVTYSEQDRLSIHEGWNSFYSLKSENISEVTNESPVGRIEIHETTIENPLEPDLRSVFAIENARGNGSSLEEAGLKLDFVGLGKEIGRGLFGALGLFKEIFMDTVTLVVGKKDKKAEKPETDPEKAKLKAEKKAENQKKQNNIKAFFEGIKAQITSTVSIETLRMDIAEKANINTTAKIGQESYKGIKDSFGRLTTYAASMFEKAQLEQDKKAKKQEKELKISSISNNPDLNLDKVSEGGFLSSTGGQGAG